MNIIENNENNEEIYSPEITEEINKHREFYFRLEKVKPYGSYLLIGVCIIMFLWTTLSGGSENTSTLMRFGANYGPAVKGGEWWRLTGAMFLHIGAIHLLFNMSALYSVGPAIERYFGNARFLSLYTIAAITGSIASVTFKNIVSAGASGAIFGLFGAAVAMAYRYKDEIPGGFRKQLTAGMLPCIVFNLVYGFIRPGIDNFAHIGGLLAGVLFVILFPPEIILKDREKGFVRQMAGVLFIILAIIPFLTEGYVCYRALYKSDVSDYPLVSSSYKECSIKYPAIMAVKKVENEELLAGPEFIVECTEMNINYKADIEKEQNSIIEGLKKEIPGNITGHEIIEVNKRKWLIITGNLKEQKNPIFIALTVEEKTIFRIFSISTGDEFETARSSVMIIMNNFNLLKK